MTEGKYAVTALADGPGSAQNAGQSLWLTCVDVLAQELPEQQFNTWIKPLVAQATDDVSKLTVFVANRFKLDWIRAQYGARIAQLLEKVYGAPIVLELVLAPRESIVKSQVTPIFSNATDRPEPAGLGEEAAQNANTAAQAGANIHKHRLNAALTFDTLVEGTANRMARAAAMHVATMPGHMYNPLFIYGGVGLGKTHLMHAIGAKLLEDKPAAKVLYIHAEQFVSDVVKAYQRKTFDEFKERYHSLDLLLIDDVQFFANKDRTQEEFFNAFEALLTKKSHIVMTSDTYPKGLADIHERLVSRFDAGLTVAIEPPELEMRVAILISKSRSEGSEMPEEVAFFVAKNVGGCAAQNIGLLTLQPQRNLDSAGAGSLAGFAVDPKSANFGREHPKDSGGLLQDQSGRHVFQKTPRQHCKAAPNRDVLGERVDTKKPSRNRRIVWWP
jgi:chromosomal replication initiator protein